MTDLQLALLGLGVLIIVAIVLFNWWQERKLHADVSERFDEPRQDALMGEVSINPDRILKDDLMPEFNENEVSQTANNLADKLADSLHQEEVINDSVNEVSLAIQEFERDMSEPYQEAPKEEHIEVAEESGDAVSSKTEAATIDELTEEAGLDETGAIVADAVPPGDSNKKLPAAVNQQIDLIALLYLPQSVTSEVLRGFVSLLNGLDKPTCAYGLGSDGAWQPLDQEQGDEKFTQAVYSLQLADRSGFVSKASLGRFQDAVDRISNKLGAQIEWQGKGDPWLFASDLDQFCADVDKMVGFHLVKGGSGPFTGTKFRGLAEAGGLRLNADGGFHCESQPDPESDATQKLFSVVNQENNPFSSEMLRTSVIHGISFQLDIPRVKNCTEVFNQMILVAKQMEKSLDANLVDDKGQPLDEAQLEKIRQQLKVIHAKMVARGVVPGSDSALRLFS